MPNLIGYMAVRNVVVPLSATTQALGKADVQAELVDTCTISRLSGGPPKVFTAVFVNEPCMVADLNPGNSPGMNEISMPVNTKQIVTRPVTVLIVGDQILHAGHTYEIFAVTQDRTPNIENSALMQLVSL